MKVFDMNKHFKKIIVFLFLIIMLVVKVASAILDNNNMKFELWNIKLETGT